MRDRRATEAADLMMQFAARTGLTTDRPPRRYLWTDAFAVCNWLALGEDELALRLVAQTHRTLAPHPDEAHPTRGGLRIGKPLPERGPDQPYDDELEWERDGQYFHYLTRWMHALDQVGRATGRAMFRDWARELATVAHRAFVHTPRSGRGKRMYWKMSVDLSRPQVPSMGQHDPVDGMVTCLQLGLPTLAADFATMIDPAGLATDDPLGLGGLLCEAYRLEQLGGHAPLRDALVAAARAGLRELVELPLLRAPAERRLAFRELGLAIGLAAPLPPLASYAPVRAGIEALWSRPEARRTAAWQAHADINDVMLATCLVPEGYLTLRP